MFQTIKNRVELANAKYSPYVEGAAVGTIVATLLFWGSYAVVVQIGLSYNAMMGG